MRIALWISFMAAIAAFMTRPLSDPDLWWHIASGRWVIAHSAVPTTDLWSVLNYGEIWRAYSWAFELLLSLVDSVFSIPGLIFSTFFVAFIIVTSVAFYASKLSRDWIVGAVLSAIFALGFVTHYSLRPQSAAILFFLTGIYLALRISLLGYSARRVLWLVLLTILLANTHITTILMVFGVGAVLVGRSIFRACSIVLLMLLCSFITPYWGGEWLTLLGKFDHPSHFRDVAEFTHGSLEDPAFFSMLLVAALSEIFFGLKLSRERIVERLFGFALIGLSVWATKFTPFATAFILLSFAARFNSPLRSVLAERVRVGLSTLAGFLGRIPEIGGVVFLLGLATVLYSKTLARPIDRSLFPVAAIDVVRKLDLPGPLLTSFNTGGFVIYRLSDPHGRLDKRVSMDGRTNTISPEHRALYLKFVRGESSEYLDTINPGTIVWYRDSSAARLLDLTQGYCRIRELESINDPFTLWVRQDLVSSDRCARTL